MKGRARASRGLGALVVLALALAPGVARADEGWTITRFHGQIEIGWDGSLDIREAIDVDFGGLEKHGIFRDIPVVYEYDGERYRLIQLTLVWVTDGAARPVPVERSRVGPNERFRIGDPNRTITGAQTYRIRYVVRGALNAFADHDELFWNVNGGNWPVATSAASAEVVLDRGGLERATCFQGPTGSTEPCAHAGADRRIEYRATRPLSAGEQLTIVTGIRKGVVTEPTPVLALKEEIDGRNPFAVNTWTVGTASVLFLGGLAFLAGNWWRYGRDRHFKNVYYLNQDAEEHARPLFWRDPVVVEYEPPTKLSPAQIGVLLDERADTKDITATIVDLAVRGHLKIEELPKSWMFGSPDWQLTRTRPVDGADDDLAPHETIVLDGLFKASQEKSSATISDLRGEFFGTLARAQDALYKDAEQRRLFSQHPEAVRSLYSWLGLATAMAGGVLVSIAAATMGWGVALLPIPLLGILMYATRSAMPRRTALGSELLWRTLGFRLYIETAEKHRMEFAEREQIFAKYLPYAIVFGSVGKWTRAFRDIDMEKATGGWFSGSSIGATREGSGRFDAGRFSSGMQGFFSAVSAASTAAAGGDSGFGGGGGAGGGGGGGGGGSW